MADQSLQTRSRAAGAAPDSSPNSSPDHGPSGAAGVRPRTDPSKGEAALERLLKGNIRERGPACSVGKALVEMGEEHRGKFHYLIEETDRSAAQISEVLHMLGYEVSKFMIQHHRNRARGTGCKCPA